MMETQEVDYVPPDAFRKIDFDDVTRDRDNPVSTAPFSRSHKFYELNISGGLLAFSRKRRTSLQRENPSRKGF
jgi:hypothetical protein